ncbi:MAG: PIG-L family deacetylase [Gemmatimonadaceae bacterium]
MRLIAALFSSLSIAGAQQPIGAVALGDLVQGLGVSTRVLVIGAHPDDEDTYLISWLARGRHVETAYLSLTRGEGGQNLIGNELGYALGQIRTEELLAARRVDGAHQYFTRAVDFGFSKSVVETAAKWPRELILRDVVAVIRAFRPHVIVSVWTGTEADGHGHHQYAGMIAREGFEAAADAGRFATTVGSVLPPWAPSKFYRVARVSGGFSTTPDSSRSPGNVKFNVGEYNPLFGRSYAEIAAMSRSQHLSQGMGMVLPLGTIWDGLTLDTSRVGATRATDTDIFSGIDTTWARFDHAPLDTLKPQLSRLAGAMATARVVQDVDKPSELVPVLGRVLGAARRARGGVGCADTQVVRCPADRADLAMALNTVIDRASRALILAAGVTIDAQSSREKVALRDSVDVTVAIYNRGTWNVELVDGAVVIEDKSSDLGAGGVPILPDSALRLGGRVEMPGVTYPWWLVYGTDERLPLYAMRDGTGEPRAPLVPQMILGDDRVRSSGVDLVLRINGTDVRASASPIVYRFADPARGEQRHPLAGVPRITTTFQSSVEYIRANRPVDRSVRVEVTSAWSKADTVDVQLGLPPGLRADSLGKRVVLPPFGKASVFFRIRGTVRQNDYRIFGRAVNRSAAYQLGFVEILYDHIRPVRYYQPPEIQLAAVDVNIPANLEVAYVRGVGDNIPRMLEQLEIRSKVIAPDAIPSLDPAAYSTLVIGPRAFEASDVVAASASAIQDFARRGGTVVVQYSPNIDRRGLLPFPVTFARPVDRVTDETAVVTFLSPAHRIVNAPNRITAVDFATWGQERGLYMPRAFDPQYTAIFEIHDQGEPPNRGGILVAPLGKGTYIYTSLSFFRQLPGGNPGAARLFVNLLSAGLGSPPTP